jgi:hypothetical protein
MAETEKKPMTLEQIQERAESAQDHIEKAIKDGLVMRRGLCQNAATIPAYWGAVKSVNNLLVDLLNAHTDGIETLEQAPDNIITPKSGGK